MVEKLQHPFQLNDAFWQALDKLWEAVRREGLDPATTISRWCGKKPSTIYAWRERAATPKSWRDVSLLKVRSTESGFRCFASFDIAPTMRLTPYGEARADGRLDDEISAGLQVMARLSVAFTGEEIERLGEELRELADRVIEEGRRKAGQTTELKAVGGAR